MAYTFRSIEGQRGATAALGRDVNRVPDEVNTALLANPGARDALRNEAVNQCELL